VHPKFKILLLLIDEPGSGGGISRYEAHLLQSLLASDAEVDFLFINRYQSFRRLRFFWHAIRHQIKHSADVVFCGHLDLTPVAWVLQLLFSPIWWQQVHGVEGWSMPSRIKAQMLQRVSLVTCVSRFSRKRFLSWSRLPAHVVSVLPNTVDKPGPADEQGINLKGSPVLLTVSRLSSGEQYKGHDRVLRVMPELLQQYPELLYVIAGDGDDRERLENLAKQVGVTEHVLFLTDVSDAERNFLYDASDLFVMPSEGEGFGIVFLEAMSHGCPVLAFGGDGSVDPLQDGRLGCVSSAETLALDIKRMLEVGRQPDLADEVIMVFGAQNFSSHVAGLVGQLRMAS